MKSKLVPIFLIVAGIYIIYRSYTVSHNMSLYNNGIEVKAVIEAKDVNYQKISYSYIINNKTYIKNRGVTDSIYNNFVVGDKIAVILDNNNPEHALIKNNDVAISMISLGRYGYKNPVVVPVYLGFIVGIILFIYGVYLYARMYKKNKKIL